MIGIQITDVTTIFTGLKDTEFATLDFEGLQRKLEPQYGVEAMEDGSKDRYFQDAEDDIKKLVPEGIVGRVPIKGRVAEIIYQMVGGLKAGMGYCGTLDIAALQRAKFVKITSAGVRESHPHDIQIQKEAPNYSAR